MIPVPAAAEKNIRNAAASEICILRVNKIPLGVGCQHLKLKDIDCTCKTFDSG
jgi:hypothetical protein